MRRFIYAVLTAASIGFAFAVTVTPAPASTATYVFCGAGDEIFCGGMRAYAAQVGGQVRYWHQWRAVVSEIRARRLRSVRLAGQSCGGSAAVNVAKAIRPVRVSRLAIFDGAQVFCRTDKAPTNVARVWSTVRTNGGLGGAVMQDRTGRVRERVRNDLGHTQIGFDAGVRRDAVVFFR